ncbi:hypothetical protein EDB19DRAFT_1648369 [Suillus lakei]|nr:hypothetical protein EDB19DRAFT_1648369 [Suillus lakei]
MDRLHSDPSFLVCPDFMTEWYRVSRTSMVNANIMEAQAAETLRNIWITTNEDLCLQWHQQVIEDEHLNAERHHLAKEEAERQKAVLELEEATTRADKRKKNCFKHLPIPVQPHPLINDEEALLDKGHYVELYYWTNHGLNDAMINYRT